MGSLFGNKPQKVSSTAPVVSGLRMQTSASGRAIPLLYGKTRVAANLIWYGDFRAQEHRSQQSAGGKGGGGGGAIESVSYSYEVALQLGLCEGPVRAICNTWVGKQIGDLANWQFTAQLGGADQQALPYLLSQPHLAAEALAYRYTACVGTGQLALGDDPSLPNMSFEVDSLLGVSETVRDANPADVLADLLTHPGHGLGVAASHLGDLAPLRQWCLAAGLLVSPAYTEQQPVRDMLGRLLQIAAAGVYCSGDILKLVPLADSPANQNGTLYQPDLTPVYDLGDDDFLPGDDGDPVQCQRTAAGDVCNAVRVKFTNRAKDYNEDMVEAKDADAIARYGLRLQELTLLEIADPAVARLVAQLVLQRQRIRHRYRFRLGWQFALLEPTDLVTLTDPALGLARTLVRITEIDEDEDGTLSLLAEEVNVGTVQASHYPSQASEGYTVNHNADPGPANPPVIFEPPLALAGNPEIWLATSGSHADWGGCDVWVSDDNASYRRLGRVHGPARHGVLAAPLAEGAAIDTVNPLQLDMRASGGRLLPATQHDADTLTSLCYADGELLAYRDATLTAPGRYRLDYLVRGAYGSQIAAHATGSPFIRLDQTVARFGYDKNRLGQTLYIKLQSFNIYGSHPENLADVAVYPYLLKGAALADVPGLALEQPFTGHSCKIRWDAVDAAAGYMVEVWAGTPQLRRRTVSVGNALRYEYHWEDALADGGPWRQLVLRVRAISATGASGNWATLVASNPVPPALTGIQVTPGYNSVFFSCHQPADPDVSGIRVWLSATAGFTPGPDSLAYDGPDYTLTLYQQQSGQPLQAGTSYYLRAAAYDAFGKDELNVSSEYAVTPLSVAGGIKPGEIDAAMLQGIETSKLYGTLQDWQIDSLNAFKIAGQLVDSQLAALNAGKLIGQLQDRQIAGVAADKLLGQVRLTQLAADVQGPLGSAINTANQALAKANDAATATTVQQLQARLDNTDNHLAGSLNRLGNVEAAVSGKAAASHLDALSARISRRKHYRLITRGNDYDQRQPLPWLGLRDENDTPLAGVERSYSVVSFDSNGQPAQVRYFDTCGIGEASAVSMAAHLNSLPAGTSVAIYSFDEPRNNRLSGGLPDAIYRCGGSRAVFGATSFCFRSVYVLLGKAGSPPGSAFEAYVGTQDNDPAAMLDISFDLVNGQFTAISPAAGSQASAALNRLGNVEAQLPGLARAQEVTQLHARLDNTDNHVAGNLNRLSNVEAAVSGKAAASDVTQLQARLNAGGDIRTSLDSKAPYSSVEALNNRLGNAEATLAGKASASTLDSLQARVGRRKHYRLITRGNDYDQRQPLPWLGLRDENDTPLAGVERSYSVVSFDSNGQPAQVRYFDTCGIGEASAASMAAHLNSLPAGTSVAIYSFDEPRNNRLSGGLPDAIYRCGGSRAVFGADSFCFRSVYVLLGKAGSTPGSAFEAYVGTQDNDPAAMLDISFDLVSGQFTAISPAAGSQASAALNRLGNVEAQLPGLARAQEVTQLHARLDGMDAAVAGKAPHSSVEALNNRLGNAEASLAGKASANTLDSLQARVGRRKHYRLITRGNDYDQRQPLPWLGLRDENDTPLAGVERSYSVVSFDSNGQPAQVRYFDTCGIGEASAVSMAAHLNSLPAGTSVALYSFDEPRNNRLSGGLPDAIYRCGGSRAVFGATSFCFRSVYVLLGKAGSTPGSAFEAYVGTQDNDPAAMLDINFDLVNGQFTAISPAAGSQASAALNRLGNVEAQLPGLARAQEVTQLHARLDGMDAAVAGKAPYSSVEALNNRLGNAEATLAGKASANTLDTLQARVGQAEASVVQLQSAQASLDGKVVSKWGVALGASAPDGRRTVAGVQAFNDGTVASIALSATSVLIGEHSNLISDPDAAFGGDGWQAGQRGEENGRPYLIAPGGMRDLFHGNWITIQGGERFYVSYEARCPAGNIPMRLGLCFTDSLQQQYDWPGILLPASGNWASASGEISAPPWASRARVWLQRESHAPDAPTWHVRAMAIRRKNAAKLLVDGSITTNLLQAEAITADKIAANQISSTHVIAGSLTGDRIAVNSLTGDRIQAGTLNANHIDTRNLTIRDAAGNIIFGAGRNLEVSNITGLGALATASAVGANQVYGLGPLATKAQVAASDLAVGSLSAISANLGQVTAGTLRNAQWTSLIDLNATGRNPFIATSGGFVLNADGSGSIDSRIVSNVVTGQVAIGIRHYGNDETGWYEYDTITVVHGRGRPVLPAIWLASGAANTPRLVWNDGYSIGLSVLGYDEGITIVGYAYI